MVRFAPSSAAILRAIFRTSLSEKPIARSAFRSWQMPKKSTFGFIAISPMYKAGTVFHGGIRFPQFLTFVLPALFVAAPQADGRFQTAAAGCRSTGLRPSEDLSELPPLRSVVAGQEYHCPRTRSLRGSLPKLLLDEWVPLVTLLGRLYAGASLPHRWSSRILRIAVPFLAHPLDVIQSLDMYFSSCTRGLKKDPLMW